MFVHLSNNLDGTDVTRVHDLKQTDKSSSFGL